MAVVQKNAVELLAPAGDFTCLQAAIQGGADAVYFGVGELNMRGGGARNFSVDDFPEIGRRAHEAKIKVYLALNVLVLPSELSRVDDILSNAKDHVDAVICWDPAVITRCRAYGIPFHISTQASVANAESARFYKDLGAKRIVLARECSLDDVRSIRSEADIPVEVFGHGAMCVSVSGRCFFSQDVFGLSANRGKCLQNCRRKYRITDSEDEGADFELGENYVLSAKDMCTLPFLEMILEAGVDALKIEGRGRNAEYVQTVTRAYRTAIDGWAAGALDDQLKEKLIASVKTVFHRDFSSGFYMGVPVNEFAQSYGNCSKTRKEIVGIVENQYRKAGAVAILVQSHSFTVGDTLMIQGPTTGVVTFAVTSIRQEEDELDTAPRGRVTVPLDGELRVRPNDKVFILQ